MKTQNTRVLSEMQDDRNGPSQSANKNYGRDQNLNAGDGTLNVGPLTQYNVSGDLVQSFTSSVSNPHKTLWDMVAGVKASHNSDLQFERGYCLPGTREAVLEDLHQWMLLENGGPPVCWLSGPAGVGKSAVALTLAKACEGDGLAGTFFFFRLDPKRNNPSALILTIAYGLVVTRPGIGRRINRRIAADPRILEASLEEQYRELILSPLKEKKRWWWWVQDLWSMPRNPSTRRRPNLVIIDGLDECGDRKTQTRILSVLFSSFAGWSANNPPLRFLVCSRPESWIREAFESSQFRRLTKRVILDNSFSAKKDIERYFLQSFQEIRESDQYAHVDFPDPWPAHYIIELLVDKASGQFIYAVTVIRFIKDDFAHPFDQLRIVLDTPRPPHSKSPFHELDILYHIVLSANPDHKQLSLFLAAILLLPRHASPTFLDMLFELCSGAASLALRAMHSVLDIRGLDDPISVYHTSFADFLKDESRSERFFIDLPRQRTTLGRKWGHALVNRWKNELRNLEVPKDMSPWIAWAAFCLEFPRPEVLRDIDEVYTTFLSGCMHHENYDQLMLLLAAILLLYASPTFLEMLFDLPSVEVRVALRVMYPVLNIRGPNDIISVYHTSFSDFLFDKTRSGRFFIHLGQRNSLGRRWGHALVNRWKDELQHNEVPNDTPLWTAWATFCLEFPSPAVLRDMDDVYTTFLSSHMQHEDHDFLAAILLIPHYASPTFLEMLFGLPSGQASLALRSMSPVLDIRDPDDIISVYHTSFSDFLLDKTRSGRFFIHLGQRNSLGRRWGHALVNKWKDELRHDEVPNDTPLWTAWATFCLEFPSPAVLRDMDDVYTTFLSGHMHHKDYNLLAAILLIPHYASPTFLEMLFGLPSGQVSLALRSMSPVLNIQGANNPISIYHTSFNDFLSDETRSRRFFVTPRQRSNLVQKWGHLLIKRWKDGPRENHRPGGKFPWTAWADFYLESPSAKDLRYMDHFYTTILSGCSHRAVVVSTLAAVILLPSNTPVTPRYIEIFLVHTSSQTTRALHEIDWLLSEGPKKRLALAHTSLKTFVLDQSRSGHFFIDRNYHRDHFIRRWLRVQHIFSECKGKLPLHSWHVLCADLDVPKETAFVELRKFYQELWDLKRDTCSTVVETIAILLRHTDPSLELIDFLHETSKDTEVYYYLHIGEKEVLHSQRAGGESSDGLTDNHPRFFDFLKDKCHSPDFSLSPIRQDILTRRMVKFVVRLCRDPKERYKQLLSLK
ncbi:hypothetical protein V5O48_012085 [Marasmius crinis-equi]|uniref:Nephrocystin 3-like N-terminal domain-containing protein n=1 Tax=Marasmius crinis-equi TaxID=585013 RepID=A0ABR3F3R7_9AGAR